MQFTDLVIPSSNFEIMKQILSSGSEIIHQLEVILLSGNFYAKNSHNSVASVILPLAIFAFTLYVYVSVWFYLKLFSHLHIWKHIIFTNNKLHTVYGTHCYRRIQERMHRSIVLQHENLFYLFENITTHHNLFHVNTKRMRSIFQLHIMESHKTKFYESRITIDNKK